MYLRREEDRLVEDCCLLSFPRLGEGERLGELQCNKKTEFGSALNAGGYIP